MSLALLCGPINLPLSIAHCAKTTRPQQEDQIGEKKLYFLNVDSKLFICHQCLLVNLGTRITRTGFDFLVCLQHHNLQGMLCRIKNGRDEKRPGTFVQTSFWVCKMIINHKAMVNLIICFSTVLI